MLLCFSVINRVGFANWKQNFEHATYNDEEDRNKRGHLDYLREKNWDGSLGVCFNTLGLFFKASIFASLFWFTLYHLSVFFILVNLTLCYFEENALQHFLLSFTSHSAFPVHWLTHLLCFSNYFPSTCIHKGFLSSSPNPHLCSRLCVVSISFLYPLNPTQGWGGGAGAYHSCHWVRGGGQPGQVCCIVMLNLFVLPHLLPCFSIFVFFDILPQLCFRFCCKEKCI